MLQAGLLRTFAINAKDLAEGERFYTQVLVAGVRPLIVILLKNLPFILREPQRERKIVNVINLIPVRPELGRRAKRVFQQNLIVTICDELQRVANSRFSVAS